MTKERKGLLVVDMQNVFVSPVPELADKVRELIKLWPEEHVYWTKYRNHPGSLFDKCLDWTEGMTPPQSDLIDFEEHKNRQVIEHFGYGIPAEFIEELKQKYDTIGVCGLDTDACIMAAAFNLWDADIRPLILLDYCHSSGGDSFHEMAIGLIYRQFGTGAARWGVFEP